MPERPEDVGSREDRRVTATATLGEHGPYRCRLDRLAIEPSGMRTLLMLEGSGAGPREHVPQYEPFSVTVTADDEVWRVDVTFDAGSWPVDGQGLWEVQLVVLRKERLDV